jgi:hypothetical protein
MIFIASGLTQSKRNPCLFFKITENEQRILASVVNDIIGVLSDKHKYAKIVNEAKIEMIKLEAKEHTLIRFLKKVWHV